jgi:hypothetical protein
MIYTNAYTAIARFIGNSLLRRMLSRRLLVFPTIARFMYVGHNACDDVVASFPLSMFSF